MYLFQKITSEGYLFYAVASKGNKKQPTLLICQKCPNKVCTSSMLIIQLLFNELVLQTFQLFYQLTIVFIYKVTPNLDSSLLTKDATFK